MTAETGLLASREIAGTGTLLLDEPEVAPRETGEAPAEQDDPPGYEPAPSAWVGKLICIATSCVTLSAIVLVIVMT